MEGEEKREERKIDEGIGRKRRGTGEEEERRVGGTGLESQNSEE